MAVREAQGLNLKTVALYLIVKSGESEGESYLAAPGLIIGRKGAQIRLNDPKVSSQHAVIEQSSDSLTLRDLGSKNGIVKGEEKLLNVELQPGLEFFIGNTRFQVIAFGEDLPTPPKPKATPKGKRWNQILATFFRKSLLETKNEPQKLEPLFPALVLDFMQGPQTETRWVIGYAPRTIGRKSVDLPIFEAKASESCFEILPSAEGVMIKAVGKEVRLNGKAISTEILKVGDRIQIFGTEMEVDFIE